MNILKRFLTGVMLLCSLLVHANTSIVNTGPNSLPAPAWIQAVEITESKIKIEWAPVSGAVEYKVSRFDVTNNVQLPDEYMVEPEFTSQPHDPGTTIQFEVAAIDENNEVGAAAQAEYTTTIIVIDVIASFNIPETPIGNYTIYPGESMTFNCQNADKNDPTITVGKLRLTRESNWAEFLVYSQCINPNQPATKIQYYQSANWPAPVIVEEFGSPDLGYTSIEFSIANEDKFFSLTAPSYNLETEIAGLIIKNTSTKGATMSYKRFSKTLANTPCYVPPGYQIQDIPETLDPYGTSDDSEEAPATTASLLETSVNQSLRVSPNPFHDGFKVEYGVAQTGAVQLILTDLTGKIVQNISFDSLLTGTYTAFLTTNTLPAGMYLLTVQTENGRTTAPVVKH